MQSVASLGTHSHDAKHSSQVEVKVWHRSQSKRKKRKVLVASACHSLGELVKKQESEPRTSIVSLTTHPVRRPCISGLEIRLQCRTADQKCVASRGRPQNKALLRLKIKPPPIMAREVVPPRKEDGEDDYLSDADMSVGAFPLSTLRCHLRLSCSTAESRCSSSAESELIDFGDPPDPIPRPDQNLRRRRVRGYTINSEEEPYSTDGSETQLLLQGGDNNFARLLDDDTCVDDEDGHHDKEDPYSTAVVYRPGSGEIIAITDDGEGWMACSDLPLPLYTEKITVPPNLSKVEKILSSMTMYGELSSAETADQFEPIFRRLQQEWTFIGGLVRFFFWFSRTQLNWNILARRSRCVGYLLVLEICAYNFIQRKYGRFLDIAWFNIQRRFIRAKCSRREQRGLWARYRMRRVVPPAI